MKKLFPLLFFVFPFQAFSQNEVQPEGNKLIWIIVVLMALPVVYYLLFHKFFQKKLRIPGFNSLWKRSLKVELIKDRQYRPNVLTLKVLNRSRKDVDLDMPTLYFRKLWTKRKFKLKGVDRYEIYPLYLEAGKSHELRIDLSVFFNYDRKLKRYLWAKVRVTDTRGKRYSSRYVILRRSLFS